MQPKTTALLIVDVQKGFINEFTQHLPQKIEALQTEYEHVYAFQFCNFDDSPWQKWMNWTKFMPEDDCVQFAFQPDNKAVVIKKDKYSCFSNQLKQDLISEKIDTVHIAGIDTDVCVTKTATDFFEDNTIRPVILRDYCGSHAGYDYHNSALTTLKRTIGEKNIH